MSRLHGKMERQKPARPTLSLGPRSSVLCPSLPLAPSPTHTREGSGLKLELFIYDWHPVDSLDTGSSPVLMAFLFPLFQP